MVCSEKSNISGVELDRQMPKWKNPQSNSVLWQVMLLLAVMRAAGVNVCLKHFSRISRIHNCRKYIFEDLRGLTFRMNQLISPPLNSSQASSRHRSGARSLASGAHSQQKSRARGSVIAATGMSMMSAVAMGLFFGFGNRRWQIICLKM